MSIDIRNASGCPDPTAKEALTTVQKDERRKRKLAAEANRSKNKRPLYVNRSKTYLRGDKRG